MRLMEWSGGKQTDYGAARSNTSCMLFVAFIPLFPQPLAPRVLASLSLPGLLWFQI